MFYKYLKTCVIFSVVLIGIFIGTYYVSSSTEVIPADEKSYFEQIPLFTDAITFIKKYYVREVTAKQLIYGALTGMMETLDPYSEFMPPKKYEDIKTETKGEFGGVGLVVSLRDGKLVVVSPMEGTPAERAGIKAGDHIVEIDGVSTKKGQFSEHVEKMRGKPGTEVKLSVIREGEEKLLQFTLKRDIIEIEQIKDALVLEDAIGYVRIVEFGQKTEKMLKKTLREFEAEDVKALIVDLRNNPGGLLEAAVSVCELFLPKDALIVYTKDREGKEQMRFESSGRMYTDFKPLVILINKGSASGSEIVAGAIQDNKRGIVIGQKSFGKASVQTVVPMRDGSALRLTTAEYYTPSGVTIHQKGIEPDIDVEYKNELLEKLKEDTEKTDDERNDYVFDKDKRKEVLLSDSQIKRAIEFIHGIEVWDKIDAK